MILLDLRSSFKNKTYPSFHHVLSIVAKHSLHSLLFKSSCFIMMNLFSTLSALLFCSTVVLAAPQAQFGNKTQYSPQIRKIINNAKADGIDLVSLPFAAAAFAGIDDVVKPIKVNKTAKAERVNVHGACAKRPFKTLECQ